MFTDLVGFTRLGQRNEAAALRLRAEHQAILRPIFVAHGGREVKSLGDGFLVEFPSAVDSVRCAISLQEAVAQRNTMATDEPPIDVRVGIHVGDIVEDAGDIVGDAVNVASRIEPLAVAGGICVSGAVAEQVHNKIPIPLEKIGPRRLKNVEHAVEIYRITVTGPAGPEAHPTAEASSSLRLAVLPFANLSPDPNDDFFADGLTDELISQLSRIPSIRVIARTSVLRYKRAPKPIREVAQDLGVGLALEGSVRMGGGRVRINAQLVEGSSEEHIWSSRYDRPFGDIFAIQDDIAGQIATALSGHLSRLGVSTVVPFVRAVPDTLDLEAYSLFLHGRKLLAEKTSERTIRQALEYFESALRKDPGFARARVGLAECLLWMSGEAASHFIEGVGRARTELALALRSNEALAEAHSALAGLLIQDDQPLDAEREARRAIALNPSLSDPYRWLAQKAAGEGNIGESVRLLEAAHRIDPVDVNVIAFLGRAYAYAGRDADALAYWERTMPLVPFRTNSHMTEYFLGIGDYERAEASLREMARIRPDNAWTETFRGILAARQGDTKTAHQVVESLKHRGQGGEFTAFCEGFVHFALGEEDAFIECLERSLAHHNLPLMELMYARVFETARHDPRVLDILGRQSELSNRTGSASS